MSATECRVCPEKYPSTGHECAFADYVALAQAQAEKVWPNANADDPGETGDDVIQGMFVKGAVWGRVQGRAEAFGEASQKAQYLIRYRFSGQYSEIIAQEVADAIRSLAASKETR